ncbi:DNA-packaging protein [Cognatiyoonia sp. IB215182]|uniref:DNA-packaging protein n=1 Tax=Cognatiyoonia sp. IB215182 TaxID=3097353 RepID=UPI002A0C1B47|nr:terminase family protein [Cognatiyoonia sp. IB215182]MDX8352224.1 terminase family protein [Cognatiyoonia sp. IB215182]
MPSVLRSGANLIASAKPCHQSEFLETLTPAQALALPYLFDFWALPHQVPPAGDWRTWVILGGRGAGKTRAGAEWVRSMVEGPTPAAPGRARRLALVAETMEQAREVMVFGESGIMAVSPPDRRPDWIAGRRLLVWPNGAQAYLYSAHEPESLRGPQFDALWVDELAKWRKGQAAWDMLQFCLRLGDDPRACVTTTPRRAKVLRDLLERDSTVTTHAPTQANRANLAEGFLEEIEARYGGTSLGRQEIDGVLLADVDGALWSQEQLLSAQMDEAPVCDRVVVAIDPPGSSHRGSDACGIVVVGVVMQGPMQDWRAYVIEDASIQGARPTDWAKAAIDAMHRHDADRLVAEVNQGGEMVESVVRQVDSLVPYRSVHASKGKVARAEPVAALYEQGRVWHARGLGLLEDQMCQMTTRGFAGSGSPDRVDALVWALYDLMIEPAKTWSNPKIRGLG